MAENFFEFQARLRGRPPVAKASLAAPAGSSASGNALSVTQVTAQITRALSGGLPSSLLVRGEVSNYNINRASGHHYFTLKDGESCLDCVLFRSDAARLKLVPTDGMEVLAGGRIGVYGARGRYQLYVTTLSPLGQGALELAFQQVRRKLEAEGLFQPERKKPLPRYPMRIALITSREAAALQDVLKVLGRFPWLTVTLHPVPVQGPGAAAKIAAAIIEVNQLPPADGPEVIVLIRGGGSLEDLWPFNEEPVARAIFASRIPVVTGIGHEVDVSIADLVADYHAHTPTEAAQVVIAQWRGIDQYLFDLATRLTRAARAALSQADQRLRSIERHEAFRRPTDRINMLRQLLDDRQRALGIGLHRFLSNRRERVTHAGTRLDRFLPGILLRFGQLLGQRRQQLDQLLADRLRRATQRLSQGALDLQSFHPRMRVTLATQRLSAIEDRLARAAQADLKSRSLQLDAMARQLEAISPQSVLNRGYTITTRKKDGNVIRSATQIKPGDKMVTRFADGQVESVVNDSKQLSLFE
jgi:exodeoxyribonuclease VII large subunit